MAERRHWAIIPAAGVGARMAADRPKQYLPLHGKTVLQHTLDRLLAQPAFELVLLALSPNDVWWPNLHVPPNERLECCQGGKERSDTVLAALRHIQGRAAADDWVWVHDAARPCIAADDVQALFAALQPADCPGVVLAVPINDSVKRSDSDGGAAVNVDRRNLWRALTPQVFPYERLLQALEHCQAHSIAVTDEAAAMEQLGAHATLVQGCADNIKITVPEDLRKAEHFMRAASLKPRVGSGFDVHAFGPGQHIVLGGVRIPYEQGLIAHSDGDVLLHALSDALLGALALGDIGRHFPDTDERWRGADSRALLRAVYALVKERGYVLGNADLTIIAQAPKMAPHIAQMQQLIAQDLEVTLGDIGIKATTTEKLGFTGRKEGIACQASVLLLPRD